MPTPTYVTHAIAGPGPGSGTISPPAGMSNGQLMVLVFAFNGTTALDSFFDPVPKGWTHRLTQYTSSNGGNRIMVWTKTRDGSEGALDVPEYTTALWTAYSDVGAVGPSAGAGGTNISPVIAPSVTVNKPSCRVLSLFADNDAGYPVPQSGSGMTTRYSGKPGNATSFAYADALQESAGATPNQGATKSDGGTFSCANGVTLALEPSNTAPNAPILTAPADGSTFDRNAAQRFDWDFSDPDPGDSQSKYDLRYRRTDVAKNEIQTVTITGGPTGGSFTLTYSGQTTAAIEYNATAAAVQTALEALSNIGVGDVTCTGGPLPGTAVTVTFTGALGNTNVAQMTATSSLTGGTTPAVTVATTQEGAPFPAWTDVTTTTPNTYHDFASGTFAAGDYEWQVRTYDAQGVVGPYSGSSFFTAANAPAEPTITAPLNGDTIASAEDDLAWSTPDQDAYQVRKVADNAGTPDTATVYYDSGEVTSSSARSAALTFPTNNRYEHLQVRIKHGGLWSQWASIQVLVSYTPPAAPTVNLTPDDAAGSLLVNITNPAPGAGEPPVTHNEVEVDDGNGWERRAAVVTPSTAWRYWTPIALRDYAGRVRVTAVGDNQTRTTTTA